MLPHIVTTYAVPLTLVLLMCNDGKPNVLSYIIWNNMEIDGISTVHRYISFVVHENYGAI